MRVARLLLCYVLLEDYSTNLGGAAITSDAARQDASATNPTLPGIYLSVYARSRISKSIVFFFERVPPTDRKPTESRQKTDREPNESWRWCRGYSTVHATRRLQRGSPSFPTLITRPETNQLSPLRGYAVTVIVLTIKLENVLENFFISISCSAERYGVYAVRSAKLILRP